MRAAVFRAPEKLEMEDLPDPIAGETDIVVKVSVAGICGSDLHSYLHGSFVVPGQVMGHEFSGEVVEVGSRVTGIAVGERVTAVPLSACGRCARCLEGHPHVCETGLSASIAYGLPGAFAEYVRVPSAILGGNVHLLPEAVSDVAGALVEPLSVALHAARMAAPGPTDTCIVLGLGSIGLNVVQMLKTLGAGRVVGVDIAPTRLALAKQLGADLVIDGRDGDVLQAVRDVTGPGAYDVGARADIVVEASGVPALLAAAVAMTRTKGRLRIAALYEADVAIDANMIVQKELDVSGTFAYHGEFGQVVSLLAAGRVAAEPVVTHTFSLDRIDDAFRAQLDKDTSLKVQVTP